MVASGGLGGEMFIWDIEAALAPVAKCNGTMDGDNLNGANASGNSLPVTTNLRNNISTDTTQTQEYTPIALKGFKKSLYALAMNESGTLLVSGGTEQVKYGILIHVFTSGFCFYFALYYIRLNFIS